MTSSSDTSDWTQPREDWVDDLSFLQRLREVTFARAGACNDASELLPIDCGIFAITAAFVTDLDQAVKVASETAALGATAMLVAVLEDGEVVLDWPQGNQFRIPTGAEPPSPINWLLSVGSALIVRDSEALTILCAPGHLLAVSERPQEVDDFWKPFCSALSAVITNTDVHPIPSETLLDDAEALLGGTNITLGNPLAIQTHAGALIPLLRVLASGGDWAAVLAKAISAYHAYYETEGRPGDPLRLLPIAIIGLAALAHDRGIPSSGLPDALVRGDFPPAHLRVTFEYHSRFAEQVEDPTRFLDLEGYPPPNRRHVLGTREDGELVARYHLSRTGLPHATIEFVLPQNDRPRPDDLPPALDPGERLLLAGVYADKDGASLRDAIDLVDLVLAAIPLEADAVPEAAFVNPRGNQAFRDEPGRFRRTRLLAYRSALSARLAASSAPTQLAPVLSPPIPSGTPPSAAADLRLYQKTMAAAALVQQNLTPLLDALRTDPDGRILEGLRPRPEDYALVFEREFVESARRAYETLWRRPPKVEAAPAQTQTHVAASPAGMLLGDNDLSRPFPGGYRGIAASLNPRRVWVAWKYVEPGRSSGMSYDGLVWCDDHWAWFPKPYRV